MTHIRPFFALFLAVLIGAGGLTTVSAQEWPAATPEAGAPDAVAIELVKVADGLADPVNVAHAGDGSDRLFVVERIGRIRIIQDGEILEEPFLDISNSVKIDFLEQGLLGLAFHPQYAENGQFFVYYTDYRTNGDTFVVEYAVSSDDPNVADPDSARVLLTHDQPYVNHNGGTIRFGPDGYLYISLGDGGLAGDPYDTGQDTTSLLGSILRIDVDVKGDQGYGIPADNPFAGEVVPSSDANQLAQTGEYKPAAQAEIWAYGLRNPWQFSFDRATGDLYITDVGQNRWEEINVQPADSEGGLNYGWPVLEGTQCYPPAETDCAQVGALPVAEYAHADGGCSITGIGLYRGDTFTDLDGVYFNSDFCSGKVWGMSRDNAGDWVYHELLDTALLVTGSGEDEAGDLYLTACECEFNRRYDPFENLSGTLWRIVAADQVPEGAETAPIEAAAEEATPNPETQDEALGTPTPDDDA